MLEELEGETKKISQSDETDNTLEKVVSDPQHFEEDRSLSETYSRTSKELKSISTNTFSKNFRELALRCPHIDEHQKSMLDYSVIPIITEFHKISQQAIRRFTVIKYMFTILAILIPSCIALSPFIEKWIGKTATIVCLTVMSVILSVVTKLYESFTRSYASYQTGFSLMQKESNAFFFKTNEYNRHTHPFELFISRITSLTYNLSKTEIISSPVDRSDDSMRSEIDNIEKSLIGSRKEDEDMFTTQPNIRFLSRPKNGL